MNIKFRNDLEDYVILSKKYNKKPFHINVVDSDKTAGEKVALGLTDRDKIYTDFINNYKTLTSCRGVIKEVHKWLFFWGLVICCVVFFTMLFSFINTIVANIDNLQHDYTIAIVTAMISFLSTIISVPLIVAKYLFNTKEDDNITTIITKTQEHDTSEMGLLQDYFMIKTDDEKVEEVEKVEKKDVSNASDLSNRLNKLFADSIIKSIDKRLNDENTKNE